MAFYPYFYSFLFAIARRTFSSTYFSWDGGHSWRDYIYSLSTLYDISKPFVILEIISVLTSQSSPILSSNSLYNSSYKRQNFVNFSHHLLLPLLVPKAVSVPIIGTACLSFFLYLMSIRQSAQTCSRSTAP